MRSRADLSLSGKPNDLLGLAFPVAQAVSERFFFETQRTAAGNPRTPRDPRVIPRQAGVVIGEVVVAPEVDQAVRVKGRLATERTPAVTACSTALAAIPAGR